MSIWPFRRRTRRSKTGAGGSEKRHLVALHDAGVKSSAKTGRKLSKRRRTKSTSKARAIEKDPEKQSYAYSNTLAEKFPSPPDKEDFPAQKRHRPGAHVDIESHSRIDSERRDNLPAYFFHIQSSHSNTSIDHRHNWEQLPTLKGKRSAASDSPLNRRHSRKKRREDNHTREEEIRSMSASASIPNRPLTSPLSREGNRRHGGLGAPYRSASEGSLSFPESMHSSLSLNSEGGFIVKSLDLLSPRPRLRYSEALPRYVPVSRTGSRRDDRKRTPLPEEDKEKSKTIDELADELDASGLRELMERDNRRREKKKIQETERMQRRLQRRAEKQKAEDEGRRQLGQAEPLSPTSMHRGSLGREDNGIGIGGPSAQAKRQSPSAQPEPARDPSPSVSWLRDGSSEDLRRVYNEDADKTPSVPPSPTGHTSPSDEPEKTELGTAQAVRLSVASSPRSHPSPNRERPVSDISNLSSLRPLSTGKPPEPIQTERRASDSGRKGQSPSRWTTFFRRSVTKPKRPVDDPERPASQFSTSRDSIPHPVVPAVMEASVWRKSGPPLRTTSRFREDLPESSASPSKIQSHSLDDLSSSRLDPFASRDGADSGVGHHDRPSTSTEGFIVIKKSNSRSQDPFADPGSKENLSTGRMSLPEERAPSAALSQSLASIDSEGSWLSGKPSKRNSTPLNPMRSSGNSLTKHYGEYSDSAEDLGLDGDEYYTHLSPGPGHGRSSALRESGTAIASSDDGDTHMGDGGDDIDDDEEVGDGNERESAQPEAEWKDVASHQPTVIHREPHVKSREGLLNEFREGAGTPESLSPTQGGESPQFDYPGNHEAAEVRRATSVDLGKKHARHMSAGSAKLFEVHSSTRSQEGKRRSPPPPQPQ